ncbi:phasin family protein [Plastoroseomonas arctica]|uniref:Phasin family protein n=1 Tax=Plastoroseomonas arctica TaxID=1509237 RepID=A0AAF1KJG5_9PROT|nr:TIGR01841 family phasin [Plastoroseomonas arctica]MBR0655095.1 phasin family protein [Plastoroseomonas arctica]
MASEMDFTKMFRMPGFPDMEALAAAQRRNMEALAEANRTALEGAQAVAKRHMEMVQQSIGDMTEAMRKAGDGEAPQAQAQRQAEMMRGAYERAVANMQELAELIQKSSGEALGLLNKRFAAAMEEAKALVPPTK